jgi:hypothetical protein
VRTSLAPDGELLSQGSGGHRLERESALFREALKALIKREAARRLALRGL